MRRAIFFVVVKNEVELTSTNHMRDERRRQKVGHKLTSECKPWGPYIETDTKGEEFIPRASSQAC